MKGAREMFERLYFNLVLSMVTAGAAHYLTTGDTLTGACHGAIAIGIIILDCVTVD